MSADTSASARHTKPPCPVCCDVNTEPLITIDQHDYWRCSCCAARFLDPSQHLTRDEEHQHYLHHNNDPDDPQYRAFLSRLAIPLLERIPPRQRILDYGCGPGPALAAMLSEAGHNVALYDPFFEPNPTALTKTYDVVTCTETVEHFHDPAAEFARLDSLLRPGGWLGLMTCFQTNDERFANWHYRKDPTHVVFYRAETFHHNAKQFGWSCEIPVKDVVLMHKA